MSTQRRHKRYNFCEYFVPAFVYWIYMSVKLFVLSYANNRLYKRTKTRYDNLQWLEKAYVLDEDYKVRIKDASEDYREADNDYRLADGIASPLLTKVIEELEIAFNMDPSNQGKQFLWSQEMLEEKLVDVVSDFKLGRARKAKRVLKRMRDRFNSLSNQQLMLEEDIENALNSLDQNEDIKLTERYSKLAEQHRLQVLTSDLEDTIYKFADRLKEMKQQTEEINNKTDLHGTINQNIKTKIRNDDYITDFCQRRGIRAYQQQQQLLPAENEEESAPLLALQEQSC